MLPITPQFAWECLNRRFSKKGNTLQDQGYNQLRIGPLYYEIFTIAAAAGSKICFQSARTEFANNNEKAGELGNGYTIIFQLLLDVFKDAAGGQIANVDILILKQNSEVGINVGQKPVMRKTLAAPFFYPFMHHNGATTALLASGMVTPPPSIFIPVEPQEGFEAEFKWNVASAASKGVMVLYGVQARKEHKG